MTLIGRWLVGVAGFAWVGCASSPEAPDGALLGRFGAERLELVLTAASVRLRTGCGELVGPGALVPDYAGNVVHSFRPQPQLRAGTGLLVLRGRVAGDVIRSELLWVTSVGGG